MKLRKGWRGTECKWPHNTAATGDKGRVPVLVEVSRAGSSSLAGSDDAGGWILRRAESFSGVASVYGRRAPCT
jgi:hypothetical protein